ncbi:MAG: hypothetical protein AB8F95_09990 [Bacteroidia bacterium]
MKPLQIENQTIGALDASGPIPGTLSTPPMITSLEQEVAHSSSIAGEESTSEILNYKENGIVSPEIRGFLQFLKGVARGDGLILEVLKGGGLLVGNRPVGKRYLLSGHSYNELVEKTEYRFVATFKWTNFFGQVFPANAPTPGNSVEYAVGETKTSMFNFAAELGIEVTGGVNVGFASVSSKVSAKLSAGYGREFNFEERKTSKYYVPLFTPVKDTRILIWRRDTFYIMQSRINITGKEEWHNVIGMEPLREDSQKVQYQIFPQLPPAKE